MPLTPRPLHTGYSLATRLSGEPTVIGKFSDLNTSLQVFMRMIFNGYVNRVTEDGEDPTPAYPAALTYVLERVEHVIDPATFNTEAFIAALADAEAAEQMARIRKEVFQETQALINTKTTA